MKEVSPRPITLKVYTRFEKSKVFARVAPVGEAHIADGATVELQLVHESTGKIFRHRRIRNLLQRGQREVAFPLPAVKSLGSSSFQAVVTDRHGTRLPARVLHDKAPASAPWLGTAQGTTREVPAPWVPLESRRTGTGFSVECWGRKYEFDHTHFVRRMFSGGKSLLAGPVRLFARAGGRAIRWQRGGLHQVAAEAGQAVLNRDMSGGGLLFRSSMEVDFDGMIRVDWALSSNNPVRIDSLVIEMPVRAKYAGYFYLFPGGWGGSKNAGALPPKGMSLSFRPYIWLGDEERGVAWFAESDENWFNRDHDHATEIAPDGNIVNLRLHLVSSPVTLLPSECDGRTYDPTGLGRIEGPLAASRAVQGPLRYTFGIQATPVKPVEKDAWDYRPFTIGQKLSGSRSRLGVSSTLLDTLVKAGVRTVTIFEHWADAEGYTSTPHAEQLKKIVRDCHKRGLKVILYFSFLISDITPEWRDFGKESVVIPKGGYPVYHYLPQPGQSAWRVCLRSCWQDFLIAGIARAMDEFDADGVYLDGTEYPFGCSNTEHGCGVVCPDGSIAPTYPIFSFRSAMRRIYAVVRSRKPDAQILIHNSTCMVMPTLGWGTTYWDGEQLSTTLQHQGINEVLPLDAFRAEFMGHQWGVPAELMWYDRPVSYKQAWAFTLIHDVPLRAHSLEHLTLKSAVWKVMDDFGRNEAEWLPCWKNARFVSVSPEDIHAGLYRHPRNGLLVVVSNLSRKCAKVNAQLNLSRLGLSGNPPIALDALAGIPIPMQNGGFRLSLPGFGWKLLRIRPEVKKR